MSGSVRLRLRTGADDVFTHTLRAEHAAAMMPGLPASALAPICDGQARAFEASLDAYDPVFDWIVECDASPAGRLVCCERETEQLVVDLLVSPSFRGAGVGAAAMKIALESAARRSVPTRLSVKKSNPAVRLYQRLGFIVAGSDELHLYMQHTPQPQQLHV